MATSLFGRAATAALLVAGLSACATTQEASSGTSTNVDVSSEADLGQLDPIATAAYWGTRYDRNPTDAKSAVMFSQSLRAIENNDESLRVMQQISLRSQDNPDVLLEYGKSLIANERPHEAVRPIEQAIALGKSEDWSAHSAHGVALDMIGDHEDARAQYALAISPDKAKVLNNMGLSYALSGKKQAAEQTLRQATTTGGSSRVRQNYALILAMAGKTKEAERLARSDLPPAVADGNVAYYRQLVASPAYWGELDRSNLDLPDFGDDPDTVSMTTRGETVPEPDPSPTPHLIKKEKPAPANSKPAPAAPGIAPFTPTPEEDETPKATDTDGVSASLEDGTTTRVASAAPEALSYTEE